jgi:hypothetical protein
MTNLRFLTGSKASALEPIFCLRSWVFVFLNKFPSCLDISHVPGSGMTVAMMDLFCKDSLHYD